MTPTDKMGNQIVIPTIDLYSIDSLIRSLSRRVTDLEVLLLEMQQRKYDHITQTYFDQHKKNIPQRFLFATILAQYTELCRIRDERRFIKQSVSKMVRFTQAIEVARVAWTDLLNYDTIVQYGDFVSTHPDQHSAFMQAVQIALPKTERNRASVIATGMMKTLYVDIMYPKIWNSILVLQNQIDAYARDHGTFQSVPLPISVERYEPSDCDCGDCGGYRYRETIYVPTTAWVPNPAVQA